MTRETFYTSFDIDLKYFTRMIMAYIFFSNAHTFRAIINL